MSTRRTSTIPPFAAFASRDFRFFLSARFLALVSLQMLNVALGQYIFDLTNRALYLGYVGLALFLPKFFLSLVTGQIADRYERRSVILTCRVFQCLGILLLIIASLVAEKPLWQLYAILVLIGIANAFDGPASQALVPELVPSAHLSNAVTWNASLMQAAFILGPTLSGIIYAYYHSAVPVFYFVLAMRICSAALIYQVKHRSRRASRSEISWETILAGLRFIRQKKVLLGAISLDLFAVLLGGATALLPIFANDVFEVGPKGLGYLRAAPAVGAGLMAITLAYYPPLRRAGMKMLLAVMVFGLATITFAFTKNFYFALLCLFVLGSADMVSVVIRGVLVQTQTPPEMRGRVSAVNLVFIGASNELGEFESGLTAEWFGLIPAVLIGGFGTLAVVALWSWLFPELKKFKSVATPEKSLG